MNTKKNFKILILGLVLSLGFNQIGNIYLNQKASALSGSEFKPGRIIDDFIFTNKSSMTVDQIQQFLNSKVPTCWKDHPIYTGGSGTVYYPPYTCLKDYQENPNTGANNYGQYINGVPTTVAGGLSAAQIIWGAGQEYNINPQSLIVLLQKEQGLVTDDWPILPQYQKATGYACDDSGGLGTCSSSFYQQVYDAAWQFRNDLNGISVPGAWGAFGLGWNNILYHPNAACGTKSVYIENKATAVLYKYTPYTPNDAALTNLYGTGDGCSAYGNRNFWRMFNDWFGTTSGRVIKLSTPGSGLFLVENGTKRSFESIEAFYSHGYNWSDVVVVSDYVFNSIPLGASLGLNIAAYNGKLIKLSAPLSGVFLIENGTKRSIDSADTFYSYNYRWSDVITISDYVFNSIPLGASLGLNIAAYNGKLIKLSAPLSGVFLIENGTKRSIDSADTFYSYNYRWSDVITISDYVFNSIPLGASLGLNIAAYNGKLIKLSAPLSGVFLIENGTKRSIDSADTFYSYNYRWSDVITISDYVFNKIPLGVSLEPRI